MAIRDPNPVSGPADFARDADFIQQSEDDQKRLLAVIPPESPRRFNFNVDQRLLLALTSQFERLQHMMQISYSHIVWIESMLNQRTGRTSVA